MRSLCLILSALALASASASSLALNRQETEDSTEYLQEFFFRKIKANATFTEFNNARKALLDLLCSQEGVVACTEWQAVLTIDASLQLKNVTDDYIYVFMGQYQNVDAFNTAVGYVKTQPELYNLLQTVDPLCFTVTKSTNGTLVRLTDFPPAPAIVEATVVNVKPGQMSNFNTTIVPYMTWKDTLPGIHDGQEYVQQLPVQNASVRAITNIFDDAAALQNLLQQQDPTMAGFFPTFDLACSYFLQKTEWNIAL